MSCAQSSYCQNHTEIFIELLADILYPAQENKLLQNIFDGRICWLGEINIGVISALCFLTRNLRFPVIFLSFSRSDCYKIGGSLMNVYLGFKYFLSFHEIFMSYLTMGTSSDFCLLFLSKDKAGSQSFFLSFLLFLECAMGL